MSTCERSIRIDSSRITCGILGEQRQVYRLVFEGTALVEARQEQQVVDEGSHPDRFLLGTSHRFAQLAGVVEGTRAIELGIATDGRNRGAQLVGRVADESSEPLFRPRALVERVFDAIEHLVQRGAELSGFGAGDTFRYAGRQVPRRDATRRRGHPLDRPHAEPEDPEREQGKDRDDRQRRRDLDTDQPGYRVVHAFA